MSPEFALSLTDLRLTQTQRLLESMENDGARDPVALRTALRAVTNAQQIIRGLREDAAFS